MNELFIPLAVGCAVALVSALLVVLARRPVHSVVALLAHSLSLAALYLILGADMVAMGQVLIYSGAIVVLFLFVIALLPQGGSEADLGFGDDPIDGRDETAAETIGGGDQEAKRSCIGGRAG